MHFLGAQLLQYFFLQNQNNQYVARKPSMNSLLLDEHKCQQIMNKTLLNFLILKRSYQSILPQQLNKMESIFSKLDQVKDLRGELRYWCRQNGIKISFTVNMTFTKSKTIFRKLQNTYQKGFGKIKSRWLQNELKLFHFAVLAVSVLYQIKIIDFAQEHWKILQEAFPNKLQPVLEYQAKNFTINKNVLKKKWEEQEDIVLTKILESKEDEPKWNQIAIQLFTNSDGLYFRNGKQCRQRWLNHLDTTIKHDKWTDEEDLILMRGVYQFGKKWSRIMKLFENQRTEHMIKNRFLSLILKCKKAFPFIQDEQLVLKKIFHDLGICTQEKIINQGQMLSQRKLRPKINQGSKCQNEEGELAEEEEQRQEAEENLNKNETIIVSQNYPIECIKFNSFSTIPTPSPTFLNPVPYINYGTVFPTFDYFQCYMNSFYSQMNLNSFNNE